MSFQITRHSEFYDPASRLSLFRSLIVPFQVLQFQPVPRVRTENSRRSTAGRHRSFAASPAPTSAHRGGFGAKRDDATYNRGVGRDNLGHVTNNNRGFYTCWNPVDPPTGVRAACIRVAPNARTRCIHIYMYIILYTRRDDAQNLEEKTRPYTI